MSPKKTKKTKTKKTGKANATGSSFVAPKNALRRTQDSVMNLRFFLKSNIRHAARQPWPSKHHIAELRREIGYHFASST